MTAPDRHIDPRVGDIHDPRVVAIRAAIGGHPIPNYGGAR